jgi:indolepyruvate ferredoxin oxidoreductase alpha subunit
VNARRRFKILNENQSKLKKISNDSNFNSLNINRKNKSLGIIASGIAYNYVMENFLELENPPSFLKISTYPLPEDLVKELVDNVDSILVVEEGYPFIENNLKGLLGLEGKKLLGKLSGSLPMTGELSSDSVRHALEMKSKPSMKPGDFKLPGRPPQLCKGCPHADSFKALNKVLEDYPNANVFSDIGCYTLGALPPYNAVDSCVCMGASVSMTKGGAEAGIFPSIGVIGDSTFAHSGMTPLLDAAVGNTNMVVIIVDNAAVAMTGGQPTFATGEDLVRIVKGLGIENEHVRVIVPLPKNLEKNMQVIKEEIDYNGPSVIIASRECIQETKSRKRSKQE